MKLSEPPWWWKHSKRSYYSLSYAVTVFALILMLFFYVQLGYHIIFILGFFSIIAFTVYFSFESLEG